MINYIPSTDELYPCGYRAESECDHEWQLIPDDAENEFCILCGEIEPTEIPF